MIFNTINKVQRSALGKVLSISKNGIHAVSNIHKGTATLIPKNTYVLSRSAAFVTVDDNLNTSVFINYSDFEYRFTNAPRNFSGCKITVSVDKGEGLQINAIFDFYYIPHGITTPSNYVKFGSYTYAGGIDYTHLEIVKNVDDFVKADGIYLIHTTGPIEGGGAYLEEVACYELT